MEAGSFRAALRSRLALAAGAVVSLAACASGAVRGPPLAIDELVANAADFADQRVAVEGYVEAGDERYRIWMSKEAAAGTTPGRHCINLGFHAGTRLDHFDQRRMVVSGKFVATLPPDTIVLGSCGNGHLLIVE